ncbi:MAG TPA: DUF624 domain-containing protein [Bacilli bacterium]|mgnify:FL=1|jgi:uncharacterized membrane protein YesL|nr:MAG: hypothetical protein BWX94_00137 [Tenericutes bacterium ADurb.Bin140]HOE77676.1 DUF624 domain-containing protein [Bacilli bacterium]HOR95261.1 DUF624 domain-containing protein [Bacilli bacterium]HPD12399.1 DUF624 domain-containing protein [Bacilli bacterium]HPK58095.1 DUF624 domain-containing protein [Bacilli bacterium]
MSFEEKISGKTYTFFEWVYRLVIINLLTILFLILVIPLFPALCAAIGTIKQSFKGDGTEVWKLYFREFKKYMEKAFLVELVLFGILAIAGLSIWFYMVKLNLSTLYAQAGFAIMVLIVLLALLLSLHLPYLIVTFPALSVADLLKTTLFITFRFFLSTLYLLFTLVLSLTMLPLIPISALIGISVPLFLGVVLTKPLYVYLEKINIGEIIKRVETEEDEE